MKVLAILSILLLMFSFGGCAKKEAKLPEEETHMPKETQSITDDREGESSVQAEKDDESEVTDEYIKEAWLTYAEKYNAEYLFTDFYVTKKCWLIGKENIVDLISIGGIDDVTVIKQTAVERVEHLVLGDFTKISIFDKTGESISIMASADDSDKILELINNN